MEVRILIPLTTYFQLDSVLPGLCKILTECVFLYRQQQEDPRGTSVVALAGVMRGQRTEIRPTTHDIVAHGSIATHRRIHFVGWGTK